MEVNRIYNENCLDTMSRMPDNFIDLTVTSPPYDNLRTYNGYSFDFESVARELFRVTKQGGVVVWVVGDATIKGSETGTSFRQALFFKECGFNLHDTMIYKKQNVGMYDPRNKRYKHSFEYMFVLSKGSPIKYNPICDKPVKNPERMLHRANGRNNKGGIRKAKRPMIASREFQDRHNVWEYPTGKNVVTKDVIAYCHPAIFPEQLANDHIVSWSNAGDLVYDPFMGSGTTAKMAMLNNRNYIGSELSNEYCDIAEQRITAFCP